MMVGRTVGRNESDGDDDYHFSSFGHLPYPLSQALVFHSSRKVLNDNTVKAPANEQGSGRARSVTSKSASPKAEIEPLYSLSLHATLPPPLFPSLFHACTTEVSSIAAAAA